MSISSAYLAMADLEVGTRRASPWMGVRGNTEVMSLRAFRRYSRDATVTVTNPGGVERWMAPKQARVYGILHRSATSGERMTMRAIASEAMCCSSTVSRAVVKLQAWGFFAIDVKRGRNGGITVRLRTFGDALRDYADAAWRRIRSWINVASTHKEGVSEHEVGTSKTRTSYMDATFTPIPWTFTSRAADEEWAKAERWASEVIAERRRLDEEEPDWDLYLEKVRASHGLD